MSRKPFLCLSALISGSLLPGCMLPEELVVHPALDATYYTRVNFRPDNGNVLRDCNFYVLPSTVPIGSKTRIKHYSRHEVRLEIEGVGYRMVSSTPKGIPTDPASIEAFLHKYFVRSTEALKTDALGPAEHTPGVRAGQPAVGMTKEQVYACLGPPHKIGGGKLGLDLTLDEILASDTWYHGHQIVVIPILTTYTFGGGLLQRIGG